MPQQCDTWNHFLELKSPIGRLIYRETRNHSIVRITAACGMFAFEQEFNETDPAQRAELAKIRGYLNINGYSMIRTIPAEALFV